MPHPFNKTLIYDMWHMKTCEWASANFYQLSHSSAVSIMQDLNIEPSSMARSMFWGAISITSPPANAGAPSFPLNSCWNIPFLLRASELHLAHCVTCLFMTVLSVSKSCSVHRKWASILRLLLINDLMTVLKAPARRHGTGWRAHSKSLTGRDNRL